VRLPQATSGRPQRSRPSHRGRGFLGVARTGGVLIGAGAAPGAGVGARGRWRGVLMGSVYPVSRSPVLYPDAREGAEAGALLLGGVAAGETRSL